MHNSLTGAIAAIAPAQAEQARHFLRSKAADLPRETNLEEQLAEAGFLVPIGTDEDGSAMDQYLAKYGTSHLQLIILPTEQCNFRCVYCYESFSRGAMPSEVQKALKECVARQVNLERLNITWFGGEPLVAADVVVNLQQYFSQHCKRHGIEFSSTLVSNGYLLTPAVADKLLHLGLSHLQITLDGTAAEHNKRRHLMDGGETFEKIMVNLRYLKQRTERVRVTLRHNYDRRNLSHAPEFIELMAREFADDPRFEFVFEPIGKWGGQNDSVLDVYEGKERAATKIHLQRLAKEAGFRNAYQAQVLRPNGFVCYAADPRSFVVGSDGTLYKCTVELDKNERNVVGRLTQDGKLMVDWQKVALWTESNGAWRQNSKCTGCFFLPACFGAICPKEWLDRADVTCPPEKRFIGETLRTIALRSVNDGAQRSGSAAVERGAGASSQTELAGGKLSGRPNS
ncbi:radical SAM/SPASM domain-containing protein [Limnochorda pilosa]|uniref:radical SAM/SPASM domain-containing protein n=1 Tax=Limnochorda pilosa TaxID=1555112 RepID=UPI00130E899B|nr:radical SAM protein [Limnochorda pilosa]